MQCSYYYKESNLDTEYKTHVAEECGNDEEIKLFQESMEYAASQFDTIPECGAPW